MKKNVAGQVVGAQMVTAADGTAFTGSVTVAVTVDAGTQATGSVGSGACTHEGNGYHTYAPAQAETNGDLVAFTFTGTGAVPQTVQIYTTPATGILAPTTAGRTLVVDANGLADANMVKMGPTGSGTAQTARDIGASVLLSSGTGTGQILLSNGKVDAYAINGETQTAVDIGGALVQLIPQFGNAVGSTGNTTTTIHLSGIATYDTDEIVDHLLIIFDGSTGESHSRWITAFNGTTDVATVATLPFTPQATVDLWTLTNIRRNTKPESLGTQAKADVNAEADTALSDYGPSTHSAADVRTEMDANSTKLADIVADTNELQGDWADGGRLDLLLDARASQATADAIEADTQDIQSKIGTPTDLDGGGATLAGNTTDIINYVDTVGQAIVADTQDIQSRIPAALVGGRMDATVDGIGMETGAIDAIWTRALTEAYAADGATFTGAQALYMIYALLAEASASGTTLTIKKLDGSTTAMTFTLNDASTPTSITRSG